MSLHNDNNVNSDNNILRIEDVDYFDSDYEINESNVLVINVERHVFYIDVYIFVDRLKKLTARRDNDKVQKVIIVCLKDIALIWHFNEFIDMKRTLLRIVTCDQWYAILIKRFKERTTVVIQYIQRERITLANVKADKSFRVFAQKMLRHVKVAEMTSMFNQLIIVWNNIDVKFRRDIFEFTVVISLFSFLNQLNSKINIWLELTRNQHSDNFSRLNKTIDQYIFNRQQDFTFKYFRDQFDKQSYQNYQSNRNQYQHYFSNRFVNVYQSKSTSTSILFFARQSLQITNENASDLQNQNNQRQNDVRQQIDNYNVKRDDKSKDDSSNRDDYNINNWRNRSFAYQIEKQHDEQKKNELITIRRRWKTNSNNLTIISLTIWIITIRIIKINRTMRLTITSFSRHHNWNIFVDVANRLSYQIINYTSTFELNVNRSNSLTFRFRHRIMTNQSMSAIFTLLSSLSCSLSNLLSRTTWDKNMILNNDITSLSKLCLIWMSLSNQFI